jgi:hypothetical protein
MTGASVAFVDEVGGSETVERSEMDPLSDETCERWSAEDARLDGGTVGTVGGLTT